MTVVLNSRYQIIAEVAEQDTLVLAAPLALESLDDTRCFREAVEAALKASGTRSVLVDARRAKPSSKEVNESMWHWVKTCPHFDHLAIVNQSATLSVAASMQATAIGSKKVKVFTDLLLAVRWLVTRRQHD